MSKSKNNPAAREGVKVKTYNGTAVIPVKYYGRKKKYIAVQNKETGKLILDPKTKEALGWSSI